MFNVCAIIHIKFEYEDMKTARVTDYTNQTPLSISHG